MAVEEFLEARRHGSWEPFAKKMRVPEPGYHNREVITREGLSQERGYLSQGGSLSIEWEEVWGYVSVDNRECVATRVRRREVPLSWKLPSPPLFTCDAVPAVVPIGCSGVGVVTGSEQVRTKGSVVPGEAHKTVKRDVKIECRKRVEPMNNPKKNPKKTAL